jgi:hypothetical protein
LVKRYAEVLVLDPQRKMYPIINYLLILGVKQEDLGKVILRRPQLLGYTIPGLVPTVDYLLELGVKPQMLGKVITTSPQVFLSPQPGSPQDVSNSRQSCCKELEFRTMELKLLCGMPKVA